ncbi:MAG: ABC-2 transporter permease [Tyzzerella sp.]|nr:ABC-2 transporter permease [Tyzzerella sp.]
MKGLLLKDLSILKTQGRSAVIIMAIALFMLMVGNNTTFAVVYANILFVTFGITTLSYDTHDNGYAFLFTLPISRKLYVMEKYVFSLLSIATGATFSLILMVGVSLIKDGYVLTTSDFAFIIGYALGSMVFLSIMLPVNLKFGPEKGRIAMIIVIAVIVASGFSISKVVGKVDLTKLYWGIREIKPMVVMGILVMIVLVILSVSYLISCKIMKKKEF